MSARISIKVFWEAVEARLAASSPAELRTILRGMAAEVKSAGRKAFLEKLDPAAGPAKSRLQEISEKELIADIDDLVGELKLEMEDPDEWDEYGGYDYYDDEDSLGPYAAFIDQVEDLFDRAQAAFDFGDYSLAREAYEKLFEDVFILEDDYGRGIQTADLSTDIVEARGRYLRSVYETDSLETRPEVVFGKLLETQSLTSRQALPMLDDLIQSTPRPLPDRDHFFQGWIRYLKDIDDGAADAWLREAVRIYEGIPGLEKLARSRGETRPRAYLDWFAALQQEARFPEVLNESRKALDTLPHKMPIRAAVADYLCTAASELGEPEIYRSGRWEAFMARPDLERLLDLWEASEPGNEISTARRAAHYLENYLENQPDRRAVPADWESDGLESPAWTDRSVLTHAYLLSHKIDRPHEIAAGEEVLGWSNADNVQSIVVPYFLVLLSEKSTDELHPNLASLWEGALSPGWRYGWDEPDTRRERLGSAYATSLSQASMEPDRQVEILSWSLRISKERASAIVSNQYRKSYHKAARVIVACAEVLRLRNRKNEAEKFVSEIRDKFPRHRAFQRELKSASQRR